MRMFGTFAALLGVVMIGTVADAAAVGVVSESVTRLRRIETEIQVERQSSSSELRVGKSVVATVQPIGVAVAPVPSVGLGLGYFINSNSIFQIEGTYGRLRAVDLVDVNVGTVAVNLKHFVGNSFYLKGGAAYRATALSNVSCSDCAASALAREWGTARTIDGEFAIGNQWQWDNLTLGADWIGVMVPTVQLADSRVTDAFGISSNEVRQATDAWEMLTRSAGVSVARVYVGASF